MSQGTTFLRSAIDNNEWKLIRKAQTDLFEEEELPAFTYTCEHLDKYGQLPSAEIMAEEGHPLSKIRRPASTKYYLDALRQRKAHNGVRELYPQFTECMKKQDMDGLAAVLAEMNQGVRVGMGGADTSTLAEEVGNVLTEYQYAKHHPGLRGAPTGWPTLDVTTNGLMGGDLVVIAGRPGMGKSYMLMEMADACYEAGKTIAVTSMEMGNQQLTRRWLGRRTGFNPNLLRKGELGTYAEAEFIGEVETLQEVASNVHLLSGDMCKSVSEIEAMITDNEPDVLFVDAAYLLTPSGRKQGYISGWEKISEVVHELKAMAIRYDIPIVITVQFNRNQKKASKGELDLGDIAGSDSIPQDASIVLGARLGPSPHEVDQRIVEVMKNREGDTPRFAIDFTFSPVSMCEIPLIEGMEEEEAEAELHWMTQEGEAA